jgi:hypothetical protein
MTGSSKWPKTLAQAQCRIVLLVVRAGMKFLDGVRFE